MDYSPLSSSELHSVNYSSQYQSSQTFSSYVNRQQQDIPPAPVPKLKIKQLNVRPVGDPSNGTEEESSSRMFDRGEMMSPILFSNRSAFERASEKAAKNQAILSSRIARPDEEEEQKYAVPKSARVQAFVVETNPYHQQAAQQGTSEDFASSISRGLNSSSSML